MSNSSNSDAIAQNCVLDDGLTYQQAKAEMRKGKWVRHRYFSDNEAMTDLRGEILFEDDICVPYEQFELYRFTNSRNISAWVAGGWSVCEKK